MSLTDRKSCSFGRSGNVNPLDILGLTRSVQRQNIDGSGVGGKHIHETIYASVNLETWGELVDLLFTADRGYIIIDGSTVISLSILLERNISQNRFHTQNFKSNLDDISFEIGIYVDFSDHRSADIRQVEVASLRA